MEGLQVGRIVHYVPLPNETTWPEVDKPAIITALFGQEGMVNLTVLMDWRNDGQQYVQQPLFWATSRKYSETKEPGTWHWPERVL